jgi:hypothetical protein
MGLGQGFLADARELSADAAYTDVLSSCSRGGNVRASPGRGVPWWTSDGS